MRAVFNTQFLPDVLPPVFGEVRGAVDAADQADFQRGFVGRQAPRRHFFTRRGGGLGLACGGGHGISCDEIIPSYFSTAATTLFVVRCALLVSSLAPLAGGGQGGGGGEWRNIF